MNLFDTARDSFDRTSTARNEGYSQGFRAGKDAGRTEAFNDVRDAVNTSSMRVRANRTRLIEHIEKKR